jgi:hypothetical protein
MTSISLLREKFTIRDIAMDSTPVIALGNRLRISLPKEKEPLIIRGHSMHMTLRYGAELLRQLSYVSHVEDIETLFQWEDIWEKLIQSFEKESTPNTWVAIYYKGKPIFEYNPRHMFFDVIEQCEHKNSHAQEKYEKSIIMAQNAFRKGGRDVLIEEESHVGFILDDAGAEKRFAVILRIPGEKATFITRMNIDKDIKKTPYPHICMNIAADFIEAINMAVRIGFMEDDFRNGKIDKHSDRMKLYKNIQHRLKTLSQSISQIERQYDVRYRPEKPDFEYIQNTCMEFSMKD